MTKHRVLVVDDELTMTELLSIIFEGAGYEVETAHLIGEARKRLRRPFHAVIIDKNLPDGDGVSLASAVRDADPLCETILLTGYSSKETAIEAVGAGFFAYVEKPINDLQNFMLVVRNAVIKSELQRRQQQNERLIEHMRKMDALGRLASGVAHDFNNVLAVIGLTAMTLANEELSLEEMREHAKEIIEVVGHGRALARQLVVFGRGTQPQSKAVVLNDVVCGMHKLLQSVVGHRSLVLDLSPNLWPTVADPDQLNQIALNLVVNAADATRHDGHLRVSTRNVDSDGRSDKRAVVLTVEDDGCGITPETMEHIFEPYFTTKPDGKGTGLGLATVYGIAERHGGRVAVSSTPGKGSRFDVYLPAAD